MTSTASKKDLPIFRGGGGKRDPSVSCRPTNAIKSHKRKWTHRRYFLVDHLEELDLTVSQPPTHQHHIASAYILLRLIVTSGGASAVKEPSHFEVKKS